MAKRRRTSRAATYSTTRVVTAIAIALVAAGGVWYVHSHGLRFGSPGASHVESPEANPVTTDTSSELRKINVHGKLEISKPPRDAQLGVAAPAAVLLRHVEMFQWQERCEGSECRYDTIWSAAPIDSRKFRTPAGHENRPAPFGDAKFAAGDVKLGGLSIEPELLAAQSPPSAYAVQSADLPPNLAASFRVVDGVLYAGGDPAHPAVGELRVSYRTIGAGDVQLTGLQRGTKLATR